ncbi:MAG: type I secretion system permease/ATPase [Alphaproteobacteria bacterium]|nr:type I secretion system permease/ATPase [Alphaproteobacteria bacterium]
MSEKEEQEKSSSEQLNKTLSGSDVSDSDVSNSDIDVEVLDPLLECLVFLTEHFGRAKSAESLTSGLAYDDKNMRPNLFCEAAQRLGLKAQVVKRPDLKSIPLAVLPAVLVIGEGNSCVLLSVKGKKAKIYFPETKSLRDVSFDKLQEDYTGFAIFVHPRAEFTNPDTVHLEDVGRHWFWGVVDCNRGIYGMALLGAVFINLFALTSPLFIMNVYDRVIPNNAIETGWALGIGALVIFVFDFVMKTLRGYLIDLAGRRTDVIVSRRIYDQVLNMKLSARPASSGSFANMLRDFDSVREFFTSATITGLVDLPFSVFFLFIIYKIGGSIAFFLAALILIVVVVGFILQFSLKNMVRKATQTAESKHGLLVETIHGLETVKAVGADGRFRARYGDMVGENAAYGQSSRFISGLGVNIAGFFQQTATIIVVLIGMYLVRDGYLSVGGLIACVILGGRAIAPISQIANLMTRYHQAGGALKTLNKIMSQPVERPPHKQFLHRPDLKGKISFDKVSFSYPRINCKVLDTVSFSIESGEKVGIIGRIGSGKSTVARLMLGLYEPEDGAILVDNTDYQQIDPADLRRNIGYIAQDVVLFNGSIRDNITASVPHATEEAILEVSKLAGVHEFVSVHPMGYDAPVGEHGGNLSGGQRQAVALARAMLLKPNVLICDEPTNSMDMQAEEAFKRYTMKQIKNKTFILITHKPSMLSLVDRLILMDQGKVVMDDKRDKVIAKLQGGKVKVSK